MNAIIQQLIAGTQQLEAQARQEQGQFALLGLFKHAETPGRWDLVASAPWLEAKRRYDAILALSQYMALHIPKVLMVEIGRIVVLNKGSDFAEAITRQFPTHGEMREVPSGEYAETEIKRAYLLVSDPALVETRQLQAVAA